MGWLAFGHAEERVRIAGVVGAGFGRCVFVEQGHCMNEGTINIHGCKGFG